jgi:hypothetical protein
MSNINFFADITKFDEEERMVYGYASTETLDSQGDIVKSEAIEKAMVDYMKYANIREMHQSSAVGVTKEMSIENDGRTFIAAKVVDDSAWKKVKEGVYKGFSIGGKCITKVGNSITEMLLTEISLVDRPANPEALITVYKRDDGVSIISQVDMEKIVDRVVLSVIEKLNKEKEVVAEPEVEIEKQEVVVEEVKKGMYAISDLALLLQNLNQIQSSVAWESELEGDSSTLPAQLQKQMVSLGEILKQMVQEEVNEMDTGEKTDMNLSEKAEDIQKFDQTVSEEESEQEIEKSIRKDIYAAINDLNKRFDDVCAENKELKEKITLLEELPEKSKVVLKAVSKENDVIKTQQTEEEDGPHDSVSLIKKIHRAGGTTWPR